MDTKPTIYHICPDIGNDNRLMSTTLYIVQSIPYILVLPPPMALMDLFCFPSVVFWGSFVCELHKAKVDWVRLFDLPYTG